VDLQAETVERVRAYWRGWQQRDAAGSVSIVVIRDALFIYAPEPLRTRLRADAPADIAALVEMLGDDVERVVGEARLAYADDATLRLVASEGVTDLADGDARLAALEAASDPYEWRESSADEPAECRVGILASDSLLAVGALQLWDRALGHVSVFTAPPARKRGLASQVGSAVVERARFLGVVPQWRSRCGNEASARVAHKLGFVAVGRQMTVRLTH